MLNFARIGAVAERFGELGVIERLAEPGGLPEEKRHEHEEEHQRQDDKKPAALQARFGRSGIGFDGQGFMLAGLSEVKSASAVPNFFQMPQNGDRSVEPLEPRRGDYFP